MENFFREEISGSENRIPVFAMKREEMKKELTNPSGHDIISKGRYGQSFREESGRMDNQEKPKAGEALRNGTMIRPEYQKYRICNKRQNSRADDFVFVRQTLRNSAGPIVPLMAGITKADPEYFSDLRINGFVERYLTVLEYVVSGCGHISCNGVNRRVYAGDVYILHPTFTGIYKSDPTDPYEKKWCNVSGRILPALMKAYGINEQVNIFKSCPETEKYFDRIHEILSQYREEDPAEDDLKLTHVLVDLLEALSRKRKRTEKDDRDVSIESIIKYIDGNMAASKITVDSLSQIFHINKRALDRMFKKHYGVSPVKFITTKKVECAQKLLMENYSVEEIADMLSFSSAEYFRKVFLSVCGISPKKYKMKNQTKR